jgi:hypothetical protein
MLFSDVVSLTSPVKEWLTNSRHPRILHMFDRVCNLINERGEILSVVSPEIRNGPFNMVIEKEVCFSRHLSIESPISISPNKLIFANLTINTTNAKLWNPRPDWERLHTKRYEISDRLMSLFLLNYQPSIPEFICSTLSRALANADISIARTAASQLAGLGQGLTPSGDDFIMGAILAAWIIHPIDIVKVFADDLANTAASLTTSLSAAFLISAGKGEAESLWHDFFYALLSENKMTIQASLEKLHNVGHTSGVDALAGFTSTFTSYAKRETNLCPS